MSILVVGARGMLGQDVVKAFSSDYRVTSLGHRDLDITDQNNTIRVIKKLNPNIVINCAAWTDVDKCESYTEKTIAVNSLGPKNLALACREIDSVLVQISTDYVFDGHKTTPYVEDDPPNPQSVYGKSKLLGEEHVFSLLDRYFIVRSSWLFGENGNNFVSKILALTQKINELAVVYDQVGSPTYTLDLARAIAELVQKNDYGIYHITNNKSCSWYGLTRDILEIAGIQGINVRPIPTKELKRPAARPAYSVLENRKWQSTGHTPLRCYPEALADYLRKHP
ncbi:MAG: dTDP-4-dehydrorhamnose reductase [Clostridiales bacterium]|nr:dTDP-4-dehydrorhamnose reductase [Clostridiales bacterium]MCF8022843.1 dTDP-4-dehydrorhamnose reductase [Clostridiales bacterium]